MSEGLGMSVSPPTLLINSVLSSDLESISYGSYGGSEVYWDCSDLASLERSLMSDSASINNSLPSRSFLGTSAYHGLSGSSRRRSSNNGNGSSGGSLGGFSPNNENGFEGAKEIFLSPRVSLASAETFASTNNGT
ncbi:unnamed protein product [Allacma fusca]|uniref:Uncharacterized protein n=1 Tax=Allacma fusca TaxID=39272 RepID=A0A8J2J329_9HEXA|nr:unnamed protein product [Allacma fusca]